MKVLRHTLTILLSTLCLASCRDNYYVENELHGVWQVTSIEDLTTEEVTEAQGELYYMFQRTMVALYYKLPNTTENMARYIAHFDLSESDSIGMGDFRYYTTGEGNLINRETKVPLGSLKKFGIYQEYTTFHLQQSKQRMTLTSDKARIELRKY